MWMKKMLFISMLTAVCSAATAQNTGSNSNRSAFNFIESIQLNFSGTKAATTTSATKDSTRSISAAVKAGLKQGFDAALETFLPFQFKYAILLNESVEKLTNVVLYKTIDEWFGTRYRWGGTSEKGIDCSAFTQVLAGYAFGWMLPRTAREQFQAMKHIDREDLKEGDFVFFNTRGGISHVGMYLQNNKFVHSSSSEGVAIGDLNDSYWSSRFVGAGRATQNSPGVFPPVN
jgi:lipoprotein Spr